VSGIDIDRFVIDAPAAVDRANATAPVPTVSVLSETSADIAVVAMDIDTWLSWNQSWNPGWRASIDGVDLGPPTLTDGYANGWQIPASPTHRTVELRWTPQGSVDLALVVSALFALLIVGLLVRTARSSVAQRDTSTTVPIRLHPALVAVLCGVGFFAVAGLPAALAAFGLVAVGRRVGRLPGALLATVWTLVTLGIVALEYRRDYAAGPDWPSRFGWASPLTWIAIAAVVVPVAARALTETPEPPSSRPDAL
jgi:hypothetical protein